MWGNLEGTEFDLWLKVRVDPVAKQRGFSIIGREMRAMTFAPIEDEMVDPNGARFPGKFYPVHPAEVFRVIPELLKLDYGQKHKQKPWFFPIEFVETFPRPKDYLKKKIRDVNLIAPDGRK